MSVIVLKKKDTVTNIINGIEDMTTDSMDIKRIINTMSNSVTQVW